MIFTRGGAVCRMRSIVKSPMEALRSALAGAEPDDVILVTGSFYVVGEIDADMIP
jgi:folylpolyglutamate synthase/dihydropteroate synthase